MAFDISLSYKPRIFAYIYIYYLIEFQMKNTFKKYRLLFANTPDLSLDTTLGILGNFD